MKYRPNAPALRKYILLFCISLILPLLMGCMMKVVKRPAADKIKRFAVVSAYSNSSFYNLKGDSLINTGPLKTVTSVAQAVAEVVGDDEGLIIADIVKGGADIFTQELDEVKDWEAVPLSAFMESEAYKRFVQRINDITVSGFIGSTRKGNYAVPENMPYLFYENTLDLLRLFSKQNDQNKVKQSIIDLCKELGLDGVAIIELDLAYEPSSLSLLGMGKAKASVSAGLKIINKDGEDAVLTGSATKAKKNTLNSIRFTSDTTVIMIASKIRFNDETRNMYKEAIKKAAVHYRNKILTDMM